MTAEDFDVLICGSGSAGMCAAIWLARYGIRFKILESRQTPLRMGQADGVQCRTVEIFESLGIVDALLKESYHVMEIAFWSACSKDGEAESEQGGIQRDYVGPDTEPGLSHQPHVILNQARVNEIMMDEVVRLSGSQNNVEYGRRVRDVTVVKETEEDVKVPLKLPYVIVTAEDDEGKSHVYRAQYVLVSRLSSSIHAVSYLIACRVAMVRTVLYENLLAFRCRAKAATPTGASWMSSCTPTSPTSERKPSSSPSTAASS